MTPLLAVKICTLCGEQVSSEQYPGVCLDCNHQLAEESGMTPNAPIGHEALTAEAIKAANTLIKAKYNQADLATKTLVLNAAAAAFFMGARWYEENKLGLKSSPGPHVERI